MLIKLDLDTKGGYDLFLKLKALPRCRFVGRTAEFPDEYAAILGLSSPMAIEGRKHDLLGRLFDYQSAGVEIGLAKRRFSFFWDCGLGKTPVIQELNRVVSQEYLPSSKKALIVAPKATIGQFLSEADRFYDGMLSIDRIAAANLQAWLDGATGKSRIGIVNFEAIKSDLRPGQLGMLSIDESSTLKSHYGAWGTRLIELARGLEWVYCFSGTPAPNDRIEYANHAVIMGRFPNVNSFLSTYFVNRGQTGERWELKPHALAPFYRSLSDWCLFLSNPSTYGWRDNVGVIPPIEVREYDVPLTVEQHAAIVDVGGSLFGSTGGIVSRTRLAQIAKGSYHGRSISTNKPTFVRDLIRSWSDREQTIVWCRYNAEQESIERAIPDAASIAGKTPDGERERLIDGFKSGEYRTLVSKADILGFGLNLQCASHHVFSGLQDSYEEYYQCVKRSNRVGSKRPLTVHIPTTSIERPMVETVMAKARRIEEDTRQQEQIFRRESMLSIR